MKLRGLENESGCGKGVFIIFALLIVMLFLLEEYIKIHEGWTDENLLKGREGRYTKRRELKGVQPSKGPVFLACPFLVSLGHSCCPLLFPVFC